MTIDTFSPTTGEKIYSYETYTDEKAKDIIHSLSLSQQNWGISSLTHRKDALRSLEGLLIMHKGEITKLISTEMGKSIRESEAEVEKSISCCEFYYENIDEILSDEVVKIKDGEGIIRKEPLGIIFAIMPWNFPLWQVIRAALPAISAGNGIVLKHASNVTQTALFIEEIFKQSSFPKDIFRILLLEKNQMEGVISNSLISGITFTGGEKAGSSVASLAGKYMKKSVLELGGSDPFIVLSDADVKAAAQAGARSRLLNCGESCIAAKRFIIDEGIYSEFTTYFIEAVSALKIGDPMDPETDIGPMAKLSILEQLESQLSSSIDDGGRILLGGGRLVEKKGYFFDPTIVEGIAPSSRILKEETFGPIAPLIKFTSLDEAIEIANTTKYGLGASIWGGDLEKASEIGRRLNVGTVAINGIVRSDPALPFGGVKNSGYGRELGTYGLLEFVNIKTYLVNRT